MKVFVALAFVAIVGLATAALTDEQKEKLKTYKKQCLDATPGLDAALIEKAKNGEFSQDDNLAAFLKCFGEKVEFLKADGSYNVEVIKEKLAKKTGTDVSAIVDKCVENDQKDAKKNALHLAECLKKNVPKHEGVF
ncbi:general odorant-binding protein 99a [Atheta coriaria]|uniref:general odorant-binding protein 99a n=1 Tax=Dalotia coriaria TaxID=877792 RepID=UPI0031F3B851